MMSLMISLMINMKTSKLSVRWWFRCSTSSCKQSWVLRYQAICRNLPNTSENSHLPDPFRSIQIPPDPFPQFRSNFAKLPEKFQPHGVVGEVYAALLADAEGISQLPPLPAARDRPQRAEVGEPSCGRCPRVPPGATGRRLSRYGRNASKGKGRGLRSFCRKMWKKLQFFDGLGLGEWLTHFLFFTG